MKYKESYPLLRPLALCLSSGQRGVFKNVWEALPGQWRIAATPAPVAGPDSPDTTDLEL